MRDKKKTITIKVRDLKPKKDAKGGVATNVSTNVSVSTSSKVNQQHSINFRG